MTYVVVRRDGQLRAVWRVNEERSIGWVAKDSTGWIEVAHIPYRVFVEGLTDEEQEITKGTALNHLRELGAEPDELDLAAA